MHTAFMSADEWHRGSASLFVLIGKYNLGETVKNWSNIMRMKGECEWYYFIRCWHVVSYQRRVEKQQQLQHQKHSKVAAALPSGMNGEIFMNAYTHSVSHTHWFYHCRRMPHHLSVSTCPHWKIWSWETTKNWSNITKMKGECEWYYLIRCWRFATHNRRV